MNKGLFIGGIASLVLAVLMGVLYFTLPADKMMYMIGDQNVRWAPAVVFGIVGIVLLVMAAGSRRDAAAQAARPEPVLDPEKAALNKRLEGVAWGAFLVMFGGYMLVPHTIIARGVWSIGVGAIMLGLNAARYYYHIRMSGFTTFLGVVSVIGGVLQLAGLHAIEGAFFFIILGIFVIAKPWFDRRRLFGKAEEA